MKTIMPKQIKGNEREWYIVDAEGLTLWKLSTRIATILRGKNKLDFSPHVDNGDYVIVLNSNKFVVTWKKLENKIYYRHTWYLWGLKSTPLNKLLEKKPTEVLKQSVNWMLPKNKLRASMISRLKLFVGKEHAYIAQKPKELKL